MNTTAVVVQEPGRVTLEAFELAPPRRSDVVVEMEWSGISTGTERLLWNGRMPPFPGMGYPLVPGYESVGRVVEAGPSSGRRTGERVFVPGANCYGAVKGLFGGAASRVVVAGSRALPIDETLGERGVLLALAATGHHAVTAPGARLPELVVGHGILGRLLARLTLALGGSSPTVWEKDPTRRGGSIGYPVIDPDADPRRDYRSVYDASGDSDIIDRLVTRLARNGEIVLAGFYEGRPSFAFAPAFMRETRLRISAEWSDGDLQAVRELAESGALSLDGLITHRRAASTAPDAYATAFNDPSCIKMVLDWRGPG